MAGTNIMSARKGSWEMVGDDAFFDAYFEIGAAHKLPAHFGIPGMRAMYAWLRASEERWAKWEEAKRIRALLAAEQITEIANKATTETVAVDRIKLDALKWTAERNDRQAYGPGPQVQVNNVSVGDSWLDALKSLEQPTAKATPIESGEAQGEGRALPMATQDKQHSTGQEDE